MNKMNPKEILEYFQLRNPVIVESIREIVEIESPSYDAVRSIAVVDWIENEARKTGVDLSIERIPADGFGDHLIVRAFAADAKPVLLLGHTDTVHPVGTKEQNPTRIEGDKFYGCGIFDMKANIVVMLEALRYFAEMDTRPARPITIFLSCDEEVGSYTGRPLLEIEAAKAEMCYVFEPSAAGRVKTGRKGTGMYTVKARGIPAHAGLEPEKGANAILEIARQIERLQALNNLSVGTTVNVCTARGGTTTNVIPEHAEFTIDVRFSSMDEAARIDTEIKSLKSFDERVTLEITGDINRPPMERTDAVVALYEKARESAASFDYDLGETQVGGASDGNFVAALGIPVLDGLGITGDGAHTLHEHILVSDIAKRATLVTLLFQN
ncbi:MAG TPA: M20 family metallopeptidase [Pyrinomonadaceae bacterium]|nr:M20 family metallopeptidase [Pyrinomonadaceae bacterium]